MPTRSGKKRPTGGIYETIDRPRQTHFTPRNRTVLSKAHTLSALSTRQQTLTQIDFVSRMSPEDEGSDPDYIFEAAPRSRKRRKTMPATVCAPKLPEKKTRSNKRKRTSNEESEGAENTLDDSEAVAPRQTEPETTTTTAMPPPKTPRKVIKTEIPSSQSPATTPLSIQSRRSTRNKSRSPLKDKSTNIRNTPAPHTRSIKKISWKPRLEVRDTFDDANGDIQAFFKIQHSESNLGTSERDFAYSSPSGAGTTIPNSKSDSGLGLSGDTGATSLGPATTQVKQQIKTEVRDSDSESEEEELEEEAFDAGADTQAALEHAEILVSSSSHETGLDSDLAEEQPNYIPTDAEIVHASDREDDAPNMPSTTDEPRRNTWLGLLHSSSQEDHPTPSASRPSTTLPHLDEVSAQLYADVDRYTQNLPRSHQLRTSLFDKASRPASPPKVGHNPYTHNHNTRSQRTQNPTTQHPQLLFSSSPHHPVPLSQATTVDVTQHSPLASRTQLPPSSQLPTASEAQLPFSSQLQSQYLPVLPRSSPNLPPRPVSASKPSSSTTAQPQPSLNAGNAPSSPTPPAQPPLMVPSSSPLYGRESRDGSQASPLWDGNPLTDSQLLPDSLMDLSIPPPPMMWTQESLVEEEG